MTAQCRALSLSLNPSAPWGYKRKHTALHWARDYENTHRAFEAMLSKMPQSSDPGIHKLHCKYMDMKVVIWCPMSSEHMIKLKKLTMKEAPGPWK
ncbi:hypothetical protein JVT61DRAFT_1986 [Boletus reticuloceps]|uniref:Uncharacterized protein n=1 Tax=Boletus reticuloceps TaxID=495285 RepID=A0A8I3AA89_9AGAM|nr:hypothetical protein JVT61DRAFT_1986 [Boletus reticuloceps]